MREDEIKIGKTYFYVPGTTTNVKGINFVFVFEKRIFFDIFRYKIYSAAGTCKECFINELCNTPEEAINLAICNAHGERKYDIEYEIRAIQRILKKFKEEELFRKNAKLNFELKDEYHHNTGITGIINKISKYKQFADKRKKLKG